MLARLALIPTLMPTGMIFDGILVVDLKQWDDVQESDVEDCVLTFLVHLQDRFRVASYSKVHENSNLCTFVLRRGA